MPDLTGLFDTYGRRARLYPALLTLLPPVAALFAWMPTLVGGQSLAALVGAAASFGLLYALASISRSAGKRTEKRLLAKWGSWPTTIMLRHGCADIPAPTKARYHQYLAQCGSWDGAPSAELEQADPAANDDAYASAVQWLKEQRRGAEFRRPERERRVRVSAQHARPQTVGAGALPGHYVGVVDCSFHTSWDGTLVANSQRSSGASCCAIPAGLGRVGRHSRRSRCLDCHCTGSLGTRGGRPVRTGPFGHMRRTSRRIRTPNGRKRK